MSSIYVIMPATSRNHMHVSSSKITIMLSDAPGCSDCSVHLYLGVSSRAESKFAIRFAIRFAH